MQQQQQQQQRVGRRSRPITENKRAETKGGGAKLEVTVRAEEEKGDRPDQVWRRRLDQLSSRVDGLGRDVQNAADSREVQEAQQEMQRAAVVTKLRELQARCDELEEKVEARLDRVDSHLNVLKRDVKTSFERFRETTNDVLARLQRHIDSKIEALEGEWTDHFLETQGRLEALELQEPVPLPTDTLLSESHYELQRQVKYQQSLIEQLQEESQRLSGQLQSALTLLQRTLSSTRSPFS
mmetsp:Transcript_20969/g.38996  ORF Transcript_20969/g.38996 Transcript_20969/m.38996 type:complete len:239 (+) Transcript_20969:70-786(+)